MISGLQGVVNLHVSLESPSSVSMTFDQVEECFGSFNSAAHVFGISERRNRVARSTELFCHLIIYRETRIHYRSTRWFCTSRGIPPFGKMLENTRALRRPLCDLWIPLTSARVLHRDLKNALLYTLFGDLFHQCSFAYLFICRWRGCEFEARPSESV